MNGAKQLENPTANPLRSQVLNQLAKIDKVLANQGAGEISMKI